MESFPQAAAAAALPVCSLGKTFRENAFQISAFRECCNFMSNNAETNENWSPIECTKSKTRRGFDRSASVIHSSELISLQSEKQTKTSLTFSPLIPGHDTCPKTADAWEFAANTRVNDARPHLEIWYRSYGSLDSISGGLGTTRNSEKEAEVSRVQ